MDTSLIAHHIWSTYIRYIGVGTMLVGGLWTLIILFKPVAESLHASITSLRDIKLGNAACLPRTERDIPMNYVFWAFLLLLIPVFLVTAHGIQPQLLGISETFKWIIAGVGTIYLIVAGFIACSVLAYFAGLIGSTNSPVSGLIVAVLLILSLLLFACLSTEVNFTHAPAKQLAGAALSIGHTVNIGAAVAIANDTLQDLKVGQIVGATPWKQQVMLIFGVVIAAFILPPLLQLLFEAYGIGGVFPHPGMDKSQMLAAPQAGLMAAIAQGAFVRNLPWVMISIGGIIAAVCIVIDETLKRIGTRLPVLAVGLGIYLPISTSASLVLGGLLSYIVHRTLFKKDPEGKTSARHKGLLLACGIVSGASIMGVLLAIPFAIKQNADALRLVPTTFTGYANLLGGLTTVALCAYIYYSVTHQSKET
jgi:putative OPT family oligopeptide transporter